MLFCAYSETVLIQVFIKIMCLIENVSSNKECELIQQLATADESIRASS